MKHLSRKLNLIASLLLLLASEMARAEETNTFYFTDAVLAPGGTTNIELCMKNSATNLTCLEAEIQLPEGLSLALDEEGNPIASLYRNRSTNHELLTGVLKSGNLKLLVCDIEGNRFGGNDGPILSFRVKAGDTAPTGECLVETVGESLLVNTSAKGVYSVGVTGNVLITDNPTAISGLKDSKDLNDPQDNSIYNLAGQQVSKQKKGIYIKGGKKSIFK